MFILPWARMPTNWIKSGILKDNFTSNVDLAEKISALKIYLIFCIKSSCSDEGVFSCSITYDKLMELASISRSSVSKGLKLLTKIGLISCLGIRSKKYVVPNLYRSGWCKIPVKGFMKDDKNIDSFRMFHNRYPHELNAIKLYLYFLSIRNNDEFGSEVRIPAIPDTDTVLIRTVFSFCFLCSYFYFNCPVCSSFLIDSPLNSIR